ncbi:unnamed protein product, partial [Closterium sp. NIES-53]
RAAAAAYCAAAATATTAATTAAAARATTSGTTAITTLACALLPTHSTGLHKAAALGAKESTAELGASESAAAPSASESAAAFSARASPATSFASVEALHTFTLYSSASRCFFRDCTTLTPLAAPVPVSLADPTGSPVVARASTVLPCPTVPSGSLSGLHLPTFSRNLVSNAAIQDVWIDTFIPGGQGVAICTCSQTGRHLATFTRRSESSLYTLTTASAQVAESGQVAASSQVSTSCQLAASCSCWVLSHHNLLWHHRLGHPSLLRLRSMHSRLLVSGLPKSLPSLPHSLALSCLPYVKRRQRAAPHSSEFPPTTAPLQTLHMDVWGPAFIAGTDQERYFLLVVDDYTRYTTVFPLRCKADVSSVLIPWTRATPRQLRERFRRDLPGALSVVCDAKASKLSSRTLHCIFLGFPTNAPPWQLYHPRSRRVFSSQDVTFDESVCFYRLHPHASHLVPLAPLFLVPVPPPVDPLPPQGPAPSGVSQVDPTPLVEPLEISSDSSGPAEGADPTADDTAATRRSPRLESPPGFPPRPSLPPPQPAAVDYGAEAAGAKPGGAETQGEGSGGAASGGAATAGAGSRGATNGGADSGGAASPSGGGAVGDPAGDRGAGQPPRPDLIETLSPQAIRDGGTTGGGGGAISAGGTRGAAGAGGAGAASPGGTGRSAGAGGAGATSSAGTGGATSAGGAGAASPGGIAGAGGTAGAGGARAGGTGGAGAAGSGGAHTGSPGAAGAGGAAGAKGATGTGGTGGATEAGGAGAGGTGGAGAAGHGGARTGGTGAARAGGASGAGGAGGATRAAGTGGAGAGARGAAGGGGAGGATGATGTKGARAAGTAPRRPFFYPQPQSSLLLDSVLRQVLSIVSSTGLTPPLLCPPTDQSQPELLPGSPLPAPAPHTEVTESLTERREPETRASTPVRARCVARPRPPAIPRTHGMALHPSFVPQRVVLPKPPASSLPHLLDPESSLARAAIPTITRLLATVVSDPDFESTAAFSLVTELVDFAARSRLDYVASLVTESESVCPPSVGSEPALSSDVLEDRQFELECLAAALPRVASMLLFPEGDPDALDIPTSRSYAQAIAGTYVVEVPPPRANIVDGMWIFRVKRPPGSPPTFKARYLARGFNQRQGFDFFQNFFPTPKMTTLRVLLHVAAQRDYELHSFEFSTDFLQGSLHEEIWLRRSLGFTRSFLAALGFAPSTADPSLFLCTDTTLRSFYVLVYVDELVFATADTDALALVKVELQERHACTDLGPSAHRLPVLLATAHSSVYRPVALNSTFG